MLGGEVVAHHTHDANLGEVAGSKTEVDGGAAQQALLGTVAAGDGIKSNGSDGNNAHLGIGSLVEIFGENQLELFAGGGGNPVALGENGVAQRRTALAGALAGGSGHRRANDLASVLRVLEQDGDHLVHGDGIMLRVPAVVVGDHSGGDVADFGFAGETSFLQVGHADHIHPPAAVNVGFGAGGKLRAFHAEVGAAALADHAGLAAG